MYNPNHFAVTDVEILHGFMRAHPLGTLIAHTAQGLDAARLPFWLTAEGGLEGHVARANPLWQQVADGDAVLVVFDGAQGYISPNSYPSKHETHRQVPTWNYQTVHAHGRIRIRDDEKFVRSVVARLTREHEGRTQGTRAWRMGDAPLDYISEMLAMIVGIEIEITELVGKYKLSQNKTVRDQMGAAEQLAAQGNVDLAQAMNPPEATK